MTNDIEDLMSDRALVCQQRLMSEIGPGTFWYVCLADGHLLNCGDGPDGRARAIDVASKLNSAGVE